MKYDLVRTVDATVEPVTVDQVKAHARIEIDDDDALLATYITAARQYCEKITGRAFLSQTWRVALERFPTFGYLREVIAAGSTTGGWGVYEPGPFGWRRPEILLPRPNLIEVASVTYLDQNSDRQTVNPDTYTVDGDALPALLMPVFGSYWPFAIPERGSVQITYTAGYGSDPSAVPATLQMAIMMLVAHWYENREATILPTSGTGLVSVPLGFAEMIDSETFTAFTLES